jgi:hypothetical protein
MRDSFLREAKVDNNNNNNNNNNKLMWNVQTEVVPVIIGKRTPS